MIQPARCFQLLVLGAVAWAGLALVPTNRGWCQEKSVNPGINNSFQDPDVSQFVERFEKEGREVYDQRQAIVAATGAKPGQAVADVGAGTGLFTRLLAEKVGPQGRVYAVDIARKFVDHVEAACREAGLGNVVGVVCQPDSADLPEASVDLVFLCDTYHHFEFPEKTMRSIHRALRPGGEVILIDFKRVEGESSDWILNHVRAGQEVFAREVVSAGFELVEEKRLLKDNYFLRFRKAAK
ncbi:MAG: methyltransferase domain-containing protein [Pirellulaceae bacterium]|nr:methyltransferase domain-containing protein [Pirellulaceae bacterium]